MKFFLLFYFISFIISIKLFNFQEISEYFNEYSLKQLLKQFSNELSVEHSRTISRTLSETPSRILSPSQNPSQIPSQISSQKFSKKPSVEPSRTPTCMECIDPCQIDLTKICTLEYIPVCGCNGITYSNKCFAQREGVLYWRDGECPTPTQFPTNNNPTNTPTIEKCVDLNNINQNIICKNYHSPVCGCNGKTYKNKCYAIKHGVSKWKKGEC